MLVPEVTQVPLTAKHPVVRLIPDWKEEVAEPVWERETVERVVVVALVVVLLEAVKDWRVVEERMVTAPEGAMRKSGWSEEERT